MFLSVSNIKSSSIESLAINPATNQASVRYIGNDQPYLYSNVDFAAIYNLMYNQVESIGKWVYNNCKANPAVTCYTVWVSR